MLTGLLRARWFCAFFFLFFLLLLFGRQMERDRTNYFALGIRELERCRGLAIIVLRNVEENGGGRQKVTKLLIW